MTRRRWLALVAFASLVFLATWNLGSWPQPWFDEGSHLKVPKSVVTFGVYADYDDTGFRYFGPTFGVGPTVLLPIAAAFKLWGISLVVARAVMAVYLMAAVLAYYRLALTVAGRRAAPVAAMLLVVMPGIGTLEYGRQVLGEVPALFFFCLGLLALIEGSQRLRGQAMWLLAAGACLGLAVVTKYQNLIAAGPGLALAWLATRRATPRVPLRIFLTPAVVLVGVFGAWIAVLLTTLGPGAMSENLAVFRKATEGAALAFSLERVVAAVGVLVNPQVFLGALVPGLTYGVLRALQPGNASLGWPLVTGCAVANLVWFVVASIGWPRYAFTGLALSCIPVASLLVDMMAWGESRWRPVSTLWLGAMFVMSAVVLVPEVLVSRPVPALAMAQRLDRTVPEGAVVETWEPEITFLTNHRFRIPPPGLLPRAVRHIADTGPPPFVDYDFLAAGAPDYVVLGPFATWAHVYRGSRLRRYYENIGQDPPYALFRRKPESAVFPVPFPRP